MFAKLRESYYYFVMGDAHEDEWYGYGYAPDPDTGYPTKYPPAWVRWVLRHTRPVRFVWGATAGTVAAWCRARKCRRVGHDWIDEGYATPDSGCMAGTCRRCGYSFHHTLY